MDDLRGIGETVRVMVDSGLADHLHRSAQGAVALFDNQSVFLGGDDVIGVAHDVDEGDASLGERFEGIDGATLPGDGGGFVREAVELLEGSPIAGAALATALAARPAFDVADAGIAINDGDFVRMGGGEAVGVEAAAADADEGGFPGEAAAEGFGMERLEMFHGSGRAIGVTDRDMGVVETLGEQGGGGAALGEGIWKLETPGPGFAGESGFRFDNPGFASVAVELAARIPVPLVEAVGGFRRGGWGGRRRIDGDRGEKHAGQAKKKQITAAHGVIVAGKTFAARRRWSMGTGPTHLNSPSCAHFETPLFIDTL